MNKNTGPSFRKTAPPVIACDHCAGAGVVQGLFHELECPHCDAFGWLHAVTGDVLPHYDQILVLRSELARCRSLASSLQQALAQSGYTPQYPDNLRMRD